DMPTVLVPNLATNVIFPGAVDRSLTGSAVGSSAVLIGLDGDIGHWIAPTGLPDTDVMGAFDFQARFSISPLLPLDPPDPTLGSADPPYEAADVADVGELDYDSTANCVSDGVRQEDVVFTKAAPDPKAAPSGTYEVRVDATSLCGQVTARWHAYAIANGSE